MEIRLTLNFDDDMCSKMRVICPFVCLAIRKTRWFSIQSMTWKKCAYNIDDDRLLTFAFYYASSTGCAL